MPPRMPPRKYERIGLAHLARIVGMLRLYSEAYATKLHVVKCFFYELWSNLTGGEVAIAVFGQISAART
jgi:hypothetical protein